MKIRKYIATSMPLALQQVREELGDRAIILNSRQVGDSGSSRQRSGRPQVEVTAAVEDGEIHPGLATGATAADRELLGMAHRAGGQKMPAGVALEPEAPSFTPGGLSLRNDRLDVTAPLAPGETHTRPNGRNTAAIQGIEPDAAVAPSITQQLRQLQLAVERLERTVPTALSLPPELKRIGDRLRAVGVAEVHVNCCLQSAFEELTSESLGDRSAVVKSATAGLARLVPKRRDIKIGKKTKVIGLVGPSGSGKTTAAAKIAAGFAVKHKARRDKGRIVLISADGKRVAAVDQLSAFAQMIGIPFDAVSAERSVEEVMRRHCEAHLILMDMAGCGPHEHARGREQQRMLRAAGVTEVQVVLDSLTSYEHMLDVIEWSELFPERRLLFTKVDQAVRVGGILSAVAESGVPTSYFSVGPSLPGQIKAADLEQLVSEVIGRPGDESQEAEGRASSDAGAGTDIRGYIG